MLFNSSRRSTTPICRKDQREFQLSMHQKPYLSAGIGHRLDFLEERTVPYLDLA